MVGPDGKDKLGNYKKRSMRTIFTPLQTFLLLLFTIPLTAQVEFNILSDWHYQRKAGGWPEQINQVVTASNGNIIAVGHTLSADGRSLDGLFLAIDPITGREITRKAFPTPYDASFNALAQNYDGTFVLVGYKKDRSKAKDGWVMKLDQAGKSFLDTSPRSKEGRDDELIDVAIDKDGNVLAVGHQRFKKSFNGLWLVQIVEDETIDRVVEDIALGFVTSMTASPVGGFAILGNTWEYTPSQPDNAWVLKVDANGKEEWPSPKYYGDKGYQDAKDIIATPDGGYAIAGVTTSKGAGLADQWLVKLDRNFKMTWEKTYGGAKEDATHAILALTHGGFALAGQGKRHLATAKHTQLYLTVVDKNGIELDGTSTPIIPTQGNEIALSVAETYDNKIIIAGVDLADDRQKTPTLHIGAYTYRQEGRLTNSERERAKNANYANTFQISEARFIDNNRNGYLEAKERGYFVLDVQNQSREALSHIRAEVSTENMNSGIDFWKKVQLGTLLPGQSKTLHIPVLALKNLGSGRFDFSVQLFVKDTYASRQAATIKTNQPEPPQLVVNQSTFYPSSHPKPGQEIVLKVDVENKGGMETGPFQADFVIPMGVQSLESERQSILSIPPGRTKTLQFSFKYEESFRGDAVSIVLEANGKNLPPLKSSFNLAVENQQAIVDVTPRKPNNEPSNHEIFWTNPDPNDYSRKMVEVNDKTVNIRLMAISSAVLKKEHFATKVNGRIVGGQKMDEATLQGPGKDLGRSGYTFKDRVNLQAGRNVVEVLYNDNNGITFGSQSMTFNYIPKANPNLYVLSIGVEHDDLKYTVQDANDIAKEFLKLRDDRGRGFKKVEVWPIVEKAHTTFTNLRKAFVDLRRQKIKDNDLVVLFISSHGKVSGEDGDYILIPSDFDPEYERQTSIDFQRDIIEQLEHVKGKVLVFIDACHSGSAIGSKDFTDAAASKFMNDLIEKSSGMEIIASCSDHEFSYEDDKWKNGAFTEAILEAFQDKSVEVDGQLIHADIFNEMNGRKSGRDGIITIEELRNFIQKRVPNLVKSVKRQKQNPSHKSTHLLPKDTPIYMVDQDQ